MNIRQRIMDAWTNIAQAEQEVFGDSLTFHSIQPFLMKLATGDEIVVQARLTRTVDPKVYALAESFVEDLVNEKLREAQRRPVLIDKDAWTQRAAEAMQQAIEDECEAIRKELQG